jgi:hypothetical protein
MIISTISPNSNPDQAIWNSLKLAISKSSGFQSWQKEHKSNESIEDQVRHYLRSTLETLAY